MVNLISKQHVISNTEIIIVNLTDYTSRRFNWFTLSIIITNYIITGGH